MSYLNRVDIIGNLTRDPEVRFTGNQQAVASFSVATNRRYKDNQGAWQDAPAEYHEIVVWGNLAERCQQLLKKGDRIFISGRSQTRSWETPDGQKRYKTEVVADNIIGPDQLNKRDASSTGESTGYSGYNDAGASMNKAKAPAAPAGEINIEDIPF